jgi:F-box interacting protein
LCRCYGAPASAQADDGFQYVVCNPATEEWIALPDDPGHTHADDDVGAMVRLGFNPAVSSHFHVFVLLTDDSIISGVDVYSSETGRWVHKEKGWNGDVALANPHKATVFLNGCLHFQTFTGLGWDLVPCVAAVDTDGETWANFAAPNPSDIDDGFIQHSQGRLHYASFTDEIKDDRLVVYVLEDYGSKEWVLKHTVKISDMFGSERCVNDYNVAFDWIAIHPECNVIFFTVGFDTPFMCYNMDSERTRMLCTLENVYSSYLPYVPMYSELQSLHM